MVTSAEKQRLKELKSQLRNRQISSREFKQRRKAAGLAPGQIEQAKVQGENLPQATRGLAQKAREQDVQEQQQTVSKVEQAREEARENLRPVDMSKEEFRVRQGTATSTDRARLLAEQIETKRSLGPASPTPVSKISPSESRKTYKEVKPTDGKENEKEQTISKSGSTSDNTVRISNSFKEPSTTTDFNGDSRSNIKFSKIQEADLRRERRIKTFQEREQRLNLFVTLGGRLSRDYSRSSFNPLEMGKTIGRTVLELGAFPVRTGGRVAFASEALLTKSGREVYLTKGQFKSDISLTGKSLVESYDPRKFEGLVNIGLTFLAIQGTAKAIRTARTKPRIITEEAVTNRITTDSIITDTTQVNVEALVGKETIQAKGTATQKAFKVSEGLYEVTGEAILESGKKKVVAETRGLSGKVEGGFDTVSVSKISGDVPARTELSLMQTSELVTEPVQTFKEISLSQKVPKKTTVPKMEPVLTESGKTVGYKIVSGEIALGKLKPSKAGTGITSEVSVLDTAGQNILRKTVKTESGAPIATEQILETQRINLDPKTLRKGFTTERSTARLQKLSETRTPSSSNALLTSSEGTKTVSVGTQQKLAIELGTELTQQIAKSQQSRSLSLFPSAMAKEESILLQEEKPKQTLKTTTSPQLAVLSQGRTQTKSIQQPELYATVKPRSILEIKPSVQAKPETRQTQQVQSKQVQKSKAVQQSIFESSPAPSTQPTGIIDTPSPPLLLRNRFEIFEDRRTRTREKVRVTQPKRNRPTVRSVLFNIKGPTAKGNIFTGIGERTLDVTQTTKQKKKKRAFNVVSLL